MEIYIKHTDVLNQNEKYYLFLFDTNYFYLLLEENITKIPNNLVKYYYRIHNIDYSLPYIVPKYDNNDTIKNNLIRMKEELKEIKMLLKNFEIIILEGNLDNKLFDDDFFDKWNVTFNNYILIAYYIIHHPWKAEEFIDSNEYKIANLYISDNLFIDDLKFIANYFVNIQQCNDNNFFEQKIKNLYDKNYFIYLEIISDPTIFQFLNNIYGYKTQLETTNNRLVTRRNKIIKESRIIIGNYGFPLNSRASLETMSYYRENDEDILNFYLEKKSILLEKYNTENYIDVSEVLCDPEYYAFDNEFKVFYVWDDEQSLEVDIGQKYLETAFNLIVTGNFSIVNLYRNTNGNLSLFEYVEFYCINSEIMNKMFTDLENNPDIIVAIFEQKSNLKYFIFEYFLHILINPQDSFVYKYLNQYILDTINNI